jgi:TonB family protein
LLALSDFSYPADALKAGASGTVTLTGTISQDGSVNGIKVSDAFTNQGHEKDLLVNEALHNLKTWRFEVAEHQDTVRITYRYAIDTSLGAGATDVEFALPDQVVIRGSPLCYESACR